MDNANAAQMNDPMAVSQRDGGDILRARKRPPRDIRTTETDSSEDMQGIAGRESNTLELGRYLEFMKYCSEFLNETTFITDKVIKGELAQEYGLRLLEESKNNMIKNLSND